jgi:hypothetical protein
VTRSRVPRDWRPGRHFGRRLTRIAPPPGPLLPLYKLGTAARIQRIRLMYSGRTDNPAAQRREQLADEINRTIALMNASAADPEEFRAVDWEKERCDDRAPRHPGPGDQNCAGTQVMGARCSVP